MDARGSRAAGGAIAAPRVVDPRFLDEGSGSSADDHPHADIRAGQHFLASIYDAVTRSPAWRRTLLVIAQDEWGGFFDHVPPPVATDPVVNLENEDADVTFGAGSPATYLNDTLVPQGQLLDNYYGVAHNSLPNYIAQLSGQGPNPQTQADCQMYSDFVEVATAADGQAVGQGCVYPSSVHTIADQLTSHHLTWKGYMEDIGNSSTEPKTCRHPMVNSRDDTQSARVGDEYAARHDPFVYFHSIIDSPTCAQRVVGVGQLFDDLHAARTTPNLSYITPNLCDDGHDSPCVDGRTGGLASADAWLARWIPRILASPAFRQDGLLIVTFDEADLGGSSTDATSCCGEGPGPNSPLPGVAGLGGGRVGAVVVSRWTHAGRVNATAYNHYGLLRSIEDLFGLAHLGYAAAPGVRSFGPDVFDAS